MVKISGASLRQVEIPLPDLDTQSRVVSRFETLYEISQALVASLETKHLERLPQALLRKAFPRES
jgi:hypothetical protein